jgi:hypothetical protein
LVPIKVEKGTSGIDILKKLYPKQLKTAQKGGGRDTTAGGGRGQDGKVVISLDDFNKLDHAGKQKAVTDAKEGKAVIGTI